MRSLRPCCLSPAASSIARGLVMTAAISTTIATPASTAAAKAAIAPAIAMFMAGLALVFVVGFAPMAIAHNAAHDTRHSAAFPCH